MGLNATVLRFRRCVGCAASPTLMRDKALRLISPIILRRAYQLRLAYRRIFLPITLGVRCIVVRDDGHVLLVRHTYMAGWHLPGGGVGRGETLEDAILRELHEEAGLTACEVPKQMHTYSHFREHRSDYIVLFVLHKFEIKPTIDYEIAEIGFFNTEALPPGTTESSRQRLAEWHSDAEPAPLW